MRQLEKWDRVRDVGLILDLIQATILEKSKVTLALALIIIANLLLTDQTLAQEEDIYIGPGSIEVEAGEYIYQEFPALNIPEVSSIYLYGTVGVRGGIIPNILVQLYDSDTGQMYINKLTTYDEFGVYLPMGRDYTMEFQNTAILAGETKYVDADFYARPIR